jgi:SAM-dependent methyltransferase
MPEPAVAPPAAETASELWDLRTLAAATRLCDFMFEQVPRPVPPRVVEVGAGIGTFSARLLDAGAAELLLIEPEPACAAELEARFGADPRVEVRAEALPASVALARHAGSFGLALSQNVLEHIEDDGAAVGAMARSLAPGGRLVALVPAHPRLYGRLDRGYGHYRRYTRERLRAIVEAAGLRVERLYSFNALGIPGWWAKSRVGSPGIDPASLRVYEALLRAWRPVERRVDPRVGLSLVVHARRPDEGAAG